MKSVTIHSLSITLAGFVLAGYWAFYLAAVVAPRVI
jgi:hypothetical protein